jgi:heat shock protein HslJ
VRRGPAAVLVLVAVAVAGCDDADPVADPAPTSAPTEPAGPADTASGPHPDTTTATDVDPGVVTDLATLSGIEWQLLAYAIGDGAEEVLPPDVVAVIRFDGRGGYTFDGCNQEAGTVELTDGTLVGEFESSTAMECTGPPRGELDGVFSGLVRGSTWTAGADGSSAEAEGEGVRARFVARVPPFPPDPNPGARALVADEGSDGGPQFQVTASPGSPEWNMQIVWRTAPGLPWNSRGGSIAPTSAVGHGIPAGSTVVGGLLVVHAAGAATVERAAHVADDGTATALEVVVLDAGHVAIVGTVFPPRPGVVVQWDAAGAELSRSLPLTGR